MTTAFSVLCSCFLSHELGQYESKNASNILNMSKDGMEAAKFRPRGLGQGAYAVLINGLTKEAYQRQKCQQINKIQIVSYGETPMQGTENSLRFSLLNN